MIITHAERTVSKNFENICPIDILIENAKDTNPMVIADGNMVLVI
jgi:hypothetical protein